MSPHKKPKAASLPVSKKEPRVAENPESFHNQFPAWQVTNIDTEGKWSWKSMEFDHLFGSVLPKLKNYESMKWREIIGGKNHEVKISSLINDAQRRLMEIGVIDIESLFSLTIQSKGRIWGKRDGNILRIIWWDPNHEVCPSHKKHT